MKTLYDLLEALPDDDADGLRAAFRKAAKANHPDFNPGNPEAAERFRRIVRANAILSDPRQRVAYDRLLELAKRQQGQTPQHRSRSLTFRRLAKDAMASAVVTVVLIGGYFLYKSAERSPLSKAQAVEIIEAEPAQAVAAGPVEVADTSGQTKGHPEPQRAEANNPEQEVAQQTASEPATPGAPTLVSEGASAANAVTPPPGDLGSKDIAYYRERGMRAYRRGELDLALANFGVAIELDPALPDSYVDRGIVFHRLGDLKRALSDIAEAKRLDDLNRKHSVPPTGTP